MKASLIPEFMLGLLLAIFLVTFAHAQKLDNVPIYVPAGIGNDEDYQYYARVLQGGDRSLVPGEYVIWKYPFPWKALEVNGKSEVDLVQNESLMVFLGHSPSDVKVRINGTIFSIKKPRNTDGITNLFNFASVSIFKANKDVILHRLGNPDKSSTGNEESWFLYSSTVIRKRSTSKMVLGDATGTVNIDGLNRRIELDTTTYVPVDEKITFQPYSFKIYFDNNGRVTKVQDLVSRTADWVKQ